MSKTVDIIGDLYSPLLESLGVTANENGGLSVKQNDDSSMFCTINKKNLLMPTDMVLKSLNHETSIAFHPLSENVARGDSSIQKYLTTQISIRLTMRFIVAADTLLLLAMDKRYHEKFKSSQMELFQHLPEVDEKTRKNLNDVLAKIDLSKVKFINMYNKRNGKIDGVNYNRVCVTSFPLLQDFQDQANSKLWNKIRKKDIDVYQKLFDYILPGWDTADTYSGVSESMQAPSFQALIRAYIKITKNFNRIYETYKSVIDKFSELSTGSMLYANTDFEDAIENLSKYDNIIPPLEGNIGSTDVRAGNSITPQPKAIPPQKAAPVTVPSLPVQADITVNTQEAPVNNQYQQPAPVWGNVAPAPTQPPQQGQFLTGQYPQQQTYGYNPGYGQPVQTWPNQVPVQQGQFLTGQYPQQQTYGYNPGYQTNMTWAPAVQPQPVSNDPVVQWNASTTPTNSYPQQGYGYNQQPYGYQQTGYARPNFQFKAKA